MAAGQSTFTKFDFDALLCHVRLKFMVGSSLKKSVRHLDDGEDCGLERFGKFSPSRDNLCQVGTGRDWISGVYSGVIVRIPL
jgi:hypothetical protein